MVGKNLITLDSNNWEKELKNSSLPVIVDFWAEWCVPCKMLEPIYEELAKEFEGRVRFGRLNVDENPDIAEKYGIMAIPTLIIFKGGEEVDRLIGAAPKNKLVQFIEENIK
ncbi:MAG TPA: thioredoxin [Geobacterales bacterium]|nr:thioredoxin [Geobacterales bacterium]